MATYAATLYLPGQPVYSLTSADIATLGIDADYLNGQAHLQARPGQVNKWLGALDSEPLATNGTAAVFGIFDYYGPEVVNEPAEAHTLRLFELGGLMGPLLVIEETTGQNSPQPIGGGSDQDERDPYHYDGDEYWPTYGEATRGWRSY